MHANEISLDSTLVRRLLAQQFPQWADQPLMAVRSTGTVNAVFRLGLDLYVRLPRVPEWAESLAREWAWLPRLAPRIALRIPKPVALGQPTAWYPCPWAVYQWIDGAPYQDDLIHDERQAARDLVGFIRELRGMGEPGPHGGREPLAKLDPDTRAAIAAARGVIDADAAAAAWAQAVALPPWAGTPVWIHGDLLRPNLLVRDGRLGAVIDFGGVGVGDPAADVIPAWSVFGPAGREAFREALRVDEETWRRARGYALHQALMIIPYYLDTNPEFVALAKRTVLEVLASAD